eukprot:6875407-Prymnesium_polylepis.1
MDKQREWERLSGSALEERLGSGAIALMDARWIVAFAQTGVASSADGRTCLMRHSSKMKISLRLAH